MTASGYFLYKEANLSQCILPHSIWILKIAGGSLVNLQLQFLPQMSYWVYIWCLTGPFLHLYFLPLEPIQSFAVCSGLLSCWKVHPHLILFVHVDGNRFKKFPVHSTICILPVPTEEKQPRTMMLPPLNFTVGMVFLGPCAEPFLLQSVLYSNVERFLSCLTTLHSTSHLQASLNVVQQTSNKL